MKSFIILIAFALIGCVASSEQQTESSVKPDQQEVVETLETPEQQLQKLLCVVLEDTIQDKINWRPHLSSSIFSTNVGGEYLSLGNSGATLFMGSQLDDIIVSTSCECQKKLFKYLSGKHGAAMEEIRKKKVKDFFDKTLK